MAERKIGSETYKTEPLPARDALKLWYRLLKAFGPAVEKLPEIFRGLQGNDTDRLAANNLGVAALVSVMQGLDEDHMISLVEDVLRVAMIKRQSGSWDEVSLDLDFRTNIADVFPVIGWIIREQFTDLFQGLRVSGRQKIA